jgi:hypothetical protein
MNMIQRIQNYLLDAYDRQRIGIALSKGALMRDARTIDLMRPGTWEFSGFSQNGEDGVLEVLRRQLRQANRYFIEIGTSDGIQNNSAWLVVAEQYDGLMIEGDPGLVDRARRTVMTYSVGAECHSLFVTRRAGAEIRELALHPDPDLLSLDIDGNDYFVAEALLASGFRPKIVAVEYNSAFGPDRSLTIEYRDDFVCERAHPSSLYYGVSLRGWRTFFERHGYRFVTVERKGVNAFFVDPACFDPAFLDGIRPLEFTENRYQFLKFRGPHARQFALLEGCRFVAI